MNERPAPCPACREVVELLTDYIEWVLSHSEHERVAAHLQTCPDCTAYVEQLRTTIDALGRLREENVPQGVLDELVATFRGWKLHEA
jgi:anti-sigma factor RsiW